MILKTNTGRELEITEIDKGNDICFEIEGSGFSDSQSIWIPIEQIPDLINFLQKQLDDFNSTKR